MGKKSKRKTRWRSLPIGDVSSQNEEECDEELRHDHMELRTKKATWNRGHQQRYALPQPMHEKSQMFNEDEYTKITTPRQDVLFKKGYLGKRRPQQKPESVVQELAQVNAYDQNNAGVEESQSETSSETVTSIQEMLPPIHLYNGFIDPQVGPVFYLNGGYDIYEPYSNVFNSFMIPANAAFPGGGQVLAAVPCQTLPMQPLEWFQTRHDDSWCFVPSTCVPTTVPSNLQRKKRYSTDSQNFSPQSSDSTGPPSSPQQEEEGDTATSDLQNSSMQAPYAYQGYMFASPICNTEELGIPRPPSANGVHHSDQSITNGAIVDSAAIGKRRKKKRRRKRRRDCRGDGVGGSDEGSEVSSTDEGLEEKDLKEDFPKNTTHGPNTVSSVEMKVQSNLSIFSGTDSTPTSLPPASSESCSDLSAASASHSHDEMEQMVQPLRPCLNHILEPNGSIPIQLSVENQECVTITNDNSERGSNPQEIDVLHDLIQKEGFQQFTEEKQNEENTPAASSLLEEASSLLNGIVDQELSNAVNINTQVNEKKETQFSGQKHTDMPTEKLRKMCKKSKHTRQQQEQCLNQEKSPAKSLKCTMFETASIPAQNDDVSVQESKVEETIDTSSNVRQELNSPAKEQERLAQNISEHVIADAITNAVKQCTIQESNSVVVKDEKLLTTSHGPITLAVTKWLNSSAEPLIIEDGDLEEETSETSEKADTGSKNGVVNPLPAPSNRFVTVSTDGPEKRVENFVTMYECREKSNELHPQIRKDSTSSTASNISSCGEWDLWEDTMALHDPQFSIHDSKLKPLLNDPIALAKVEQEEDATNIKPAEEQDSTPELKSKTAVIRLSQQEAWLFANDVITDSGIESGDEQPSPQLNINEKTHKFIRHIQHGLHEIEPFHCGACCSIQ